MTRTPRPASAGGRRLALVLFVIALLPGLALPGAAAQDGPDRVPDSPLLQPIDAQNWVDQADLTWDDYTAVRPEAWDSAETSQGSDEQYQTAVILMDFQDQPFLITQEPETHPFGNPQSGWEPVAPEDVNEWYYDYYAVPNEYNGGQTFHGYWMEDSYGQIGVDVEVFGPYTMPHNSWQYSLSEWGANSLNTNQCPAQSFIPTGGTDVTDLNVETTDFFYVGDIVTIRHDMFPGGGGRPPLTITRSVVDIPDDNTLTLDQPVAEIWDGARVHDCGLDIRSHGGAAWRADIGCAGGLCGFDNGFYVTAGHDESSTWQEFGEMLFENPEDVPDALGNPNPNLPNHSVTRYVPWTSWKAAANHWPNAGGGTSTQAESSGQSVFAHEFSHLRNLPDNYNNPFADNIRNYTGYWEMMSRGTFNGPGGTHNRWQVPNQGGSGLGPHHMLHFKNSLGVITADDQHTLDRNDLVDDGVAVATIKARTDVPDGEQIGLTVNFGAGGYTAGKCESETEDANFFCPPGSNWLSYRFEVADRVGNDSFVPGHGVLLSQTRNSGTPRVWLIDPNPEDIGMIDFYRPDGTPVPVVRGDPRQLNDSTFHAGTNSGSEYEYVDEFNNLHFYILNAHRDDDGVLFYDVGVRNLQGAGDFDRGVGLGNPRKTGQEPGFLASCTFPLTNTGDAGEGLFDSDIYRVSATSSSDNWEVVLPNALAAAEAGETVQVPVHVRRHPGDGGDARTTVTFTATSEADSSQSATSTCNVHVRDTTPAKS